MAGDRLSLATREFWSDTYLSAYELPARVSDAPFDRGLRQMVELHGSASPAERVLELGCAPGRWMIFYAERFGARVEGIEYTEFGARQTEENLRACGVDGIVHEVDFWNFEPQAPYDVVFSAGFIEHFTETGRAFERHLSLLRPGGRLVLEVPNYQGINRWLQRWCDPDWLALHNDGAMGHHRYRELAREHGAELLTVRYFGGFDPNLISVRKRGRRLLAPFWHLRQRGLGDRLNAPWLSAGLFVVLRKRASGHTG